MGRIIHTFILFLTTALLGYSQSTVLTGGNNFSVGLCNNKKVYAWGSNASGQVGQGNTTTTSYKTPTAVIFPGAASALNFYQVNAGSGAHALALDCNGHVWVWGEDVCGQIGDGGAVNQTNCFAGSPSVPTSVPNEVVRGAQAAGTGPNATYLHSIASIGGGNNFSIAVDSSGNVWTWGEDQYGELGDGTPGNVSSTPGQVIKCASYGGGNLTNITFVQGGDQTAYALDKSGQVWAWGYNNNNNLGDGTTANSACAVQVMKGPATAAGPPATGLTPLSGIKQLAAGDTHGMALDSSGQVWTWGGDWAPGQLGQGGTYVSNTFASRVVAPGQYTAATNNLGVCAGCTYITGATYIAAGQASSVVVMSDGSVVSFGGQGLYPGSACGTGQLLFSGTLGNGLPSTNATCQSNSTRCTGYTTAPTSTPAGCAGYGTPTYVETAAGTKLSNIISVARGDAWYFATDKSGNTYTWGFNGASGAAALTATGNYGGELGINSNVDQAYAVPVTLPTGCGGVAKPCPTKPALGSNFSVCPSSSFTLSAGETEVGYTYQWFSSTTGTGNVSTWTSLGAAAVDVTSYTGTMGTTAMWYGVVVTYTNGCGNPCVESDSVKVSPILPSWSGSGTYCATNPNVQFTITGGGTDGFKWYTASSGGSAVGSGQSLLIPKTSTNTSVPGCTYALYAADTSTYAAALMPTGDPYWAPAPCSGASTTNNGTGTNGSLTMIVVTQSITLTSVQFTQTTAYGTSGNFSFTVYDNTGSIYCPGCSPAASYSAPGTLKYTSPATSLSAAGNTTQTLTGSYVLAPGTYWIGLATSGSGWLAYTCTPPYAAGSNIWSTTYWDNSGYNIVKAASAVYQGQIQGAGSVFNIGFTAGSPYTCNRLLVCATSGTCPAPVKFLNFTATAQASSVLLEWSTATEKNSSYYSVERSTDGINYVSIGKVNAAGNSNTIRNYSFTDNTVSDLSGTVYYRIQEYDVDGETTTSAIEAINTGKGQDVKVIPNPNNGSFVILIEGESETLNLVLYNSVGIAVYTSTGKAEGNTFSQNINIQNLPAGVYYLNVQSPTNTWVKKIVKE